MHRGGLGAALDPELLAPRLDKRLSRLEVLAAGCADQGNIRRGRVTHWRLKKKNPARK